MLYFERLLAAPEVPPQGGFIKHICNLLKYRNRITPYPRCGFIDFT